jgi:hypothetical protein
MGDEISNDVAPTSRRTRALLVGLIAAAVVVAGVIALRRGVDPVAVPPPASPPAAQLPSPPGQLAQPAGPLPALALDEVCLPARTDGRTRLDVSFILRNILDQPVTLTEVVPVFPLPGPRGLGTEVRSGSCAAPGAPVRTDEIRGRGTVLVVFRLALPPTCPAPLPVQARVAERRGTHSVKATVPLLNDLGSMRFTTC